MKKTLALALSVLIVAALFVPCVMADTAQPAEPNTQSETAAVVKGDDSSTAQTDDVVTAAPAASQPAVAKSAAANTKGNTATSLNYEDLRKTLMDYNYNIRALSATLDDLDDVDTDALKGARDQLTQLQNGLAVSLKGTEDGIKNFAPSAETPDEVNDLYYVYTYLKSSLTASSALVGAQISSMESQIDSAVISVETGKNSAKNGINQVVMGAESLYVGIVTMEAALGSVDRALDTLDRAVAIYEKQEELGMASAYDVETIKYQRSQVQSQKEALEFNIKTNKMTLENMCGMEMTGTVKLRALSIPTAADIDSVDYDGNLKSATGKNLDVKNYLAQSDADGDHDAYYKSYQAAQENFACKFKIVCLTVDEKSRLAETAQSTVDYQQRTFEIAEKKYNLGMLSYEEYMTAKNDLLSAKDDLYNTNLDLFTAYRSYYRATNYGIV